MKLKQISWYCLTTLLLTVSFPAPALINPENANQSTPDWMTTIFVIDEYSGFPYLFCYGALIEKGWVASAGGCFFDAYHALESTAGQEKPKFRVRIGTSSKSVSVNDYYFSDDYQLVMFQLAEEVNNKPLNLTSAAVGELINQNVHILAREKSLPLGDPYYNPAGGRNVTCKIGGKTFTNSGAICYIISPPIVAATLQQTRAVIIDPKAPTAPSTLLDKQVKINATGARIYLDFRAQNSYPCLEDLGLPVIRTTSTGEIEMIGIVAAAGIVAGVPMCSPSLFTRTLAIAYYKDFIEETMIAGDFNNQCPVAPKLDVTYTGGNGIRLEWDAVNKATGYKLQYTSRVGYLPIQTVDMHNIRTISTDIDPSLQYTVTVMAYNANCNSQLSEPLPVRINRN